MYFLQCTSTCMSVFLLGTAELPDASGSSPAAKKRRVDASSSRAGNTALP